MKTSIEDQFTHFRKLVDEAREGPPRPPGSLDAARRSVKMELAKMVVRRRNAVNPFDFDTRTNDYADATADLTLFLLWESLGFP